MHQRPRILRKSAAIRDLVSENHLSVTDLIAPLFLVEGDDIQEEILSLPGQYRRSLDLTVEYAGKLHALGIRAVLLFIKCPDEKKDNEGTEALRSTGLMQRAIQAIKAAIPELCVMSDVALDPYSSYGHDGIIKDGEVINDASAELLAQMALSHAQAGVDFVAPSDMMDGRIGLIRQVLEENQFHTTGILSYSAKYASCFYGPFRDALDSAPGFGDKKSYQMDPANSREALKEVIMDVEEGADLVMVKPALPYLDIIHQVKQNVDVPVCAYQVSGEYAMIKAAASKGWLNEQDAMIETLTGIKRAGADLIATYFAEDIAELLSKRPIQ